MRGDKETKKLTGSALEKALAEKQFERSAIQLVGMVKASEKQGHISFAPGGCESWVDVPSAMIDEAANLGHQPCKGHSHPLFRLSLQEPTDPFAKALMGLLASALQPRQPPAFAMVPERVGGRFPDGLGPRELGLGSIARAKNDVDANDCGVGCIDTYGTLESWGLFNCIDFCNCVYREGRDVHVCWAEVFGSTLWID